MKLKILVIYFSKLGNGGMGIHGAHVNRAISSKYEVTSIIPDHTKWWEKCKILTKIGLKFINKIYNLLVKPGFQVEIECKRIGEKSLQVLQTDGFSCVYGFSGVSLESFRIAKSLQIPCILDHPNLHLKDFRKAYESEVEKWFGKKRYYGHPTQKYIERVMQEFDLADIIRVNSSLAKNSLISHGVDSRKIFVLSQPLEEKYLEWKAKKEKKDNRFNICFVGSMCLRKGFVYLLHAVSKLNSPDIKIYFVGNTGDKYSSILLQKYRKGLNIEMIPGDPRPIYEIADLFVMPTLEDGFGLVVIEAMSFGIPVIVTDRCGASELIENGKSGWIIESRNFDQLAERISFAQNNREVATKIGLGGRQKAIENSIEVHDRKLVHMIESAMKNECE